jgi:hypothetical protein
MILIQVKKLMMMVFMAIGLTLLSSVLFWA